MAVDILINMIDHAASQHVPGQWIKMKQIPHSGWGVDEVPPYFAIVEIADKDLVDLRNFEKRLGGHVEEEPLLPGEELLNLHPRFKWGVRLRWRLRVEELTNKQKKELEVGRLSLSWTKLFAKLRDEVETRRLRH